MITNVQKITESTPKTTLRVDSPRVKQERSSVCRAARADIAEDDAERRQA